ncbi:GINS complex, Psf3 component [Armillaria novae-zelandiae]|uniref:DNA replication complex GINS protein PSF3 n=1 Tax=Armillaria novae-zelandiae TaxID=153914 RepID=A0AA39PU31_9AGAR|nr:GINS complex, Psf3 component [Armillaria novae-zelandiae]
MEDDYFSIDSILADNQKIQCIFSKKIPDLGHLWGGSERDIAAQAKYQIPIWMAYIVVYSDWADFNIPTPFANRVRNALNAEPRSVRLSSLVGAGGLWLSDEQANEMSQMLTKTFRERLVEVIDQAQHFAALGPAGGGGGSTGDIAQAFREGLDGTERERKCQENKEVV